MQVVMEVASRLAVFAIGVVLVSVVGAGPSGAQTVSTYLTGSGLNGPDGFALDGSENLFVANWGGGAGTTVLRIVNPDSVTVYDGTASAPDGLAFDASGNLYVSNYATGVISVIAPDGTKSDFASGFNHPSALAFDDAGNLYVSNFSGNTVSRITPEGAVSLFASGFNGPLGLAFDLAGDLYVSNYNSGVVHRVSPAGVVTTFATVPNPVGSRIQYLVRGPSGNLYLPTYGHHQIFAISPEGVVSVLAGTGAAGGHDGPAATATFNGPNSVALTRAGDLFVSEYNANRIRKITGVEPAASSVTGHSETISHSPLRLQCHPNPVGGTTTISYDLPRDGSVSLAVLNSLGECVLSFVDRFECAGRHAVRLDAAGLANGVYFYRLTHGRVQQTERLVLVKADPAGF